MPPIPEIEPVAGTPGSKIASIIPTITPENPASFANALDLAQAVGAAQDDFASLLAALFPVLERSKAFWKDQNRLDHFVAKVPRDAGLVSRTLELVGQAAGTSDRTCLILGRVAVGLESLSPETAAALCSRLDSSGNPDAPATVLSLTRFLDEATAFPVLVKRLGDASRIDARLSTGASTLGEHSAGLLAGRGIAAGEFLLQHLNEFGTTAAKVAAIPIMADLRPADAVDLLCDLIQDVTFGSTIAEVLLSEKTLAPMLRAASEVGLAAEISEVFATRGQWKPSPDRPTCGPENSSAFLARLNQRSVLTRVGAVLTSTDFFYAFVRLFFNLKILTAVRHLVSDADRDVRVASAAALGRFDEPAAVRALKDALFDRSEIVRTTALAALRNHLSQAEIEAFLAERRAKVDEMKAEAQEAKREFENIKIENRFINAVKTLAFSTMNVVSSATETLMGGVKSVFGRKPPKPAEDGQ